MKKLITLVTLLAASSASIYAVPAEIIEPKHNTLSYANRYVFNQISDFRKDQYMLDTHTGRLWVIVTSSNDEKRKLEPIPYISFAGYETWIPEEKQQLDAWEKMEAVNRSEEWKKLRDRVRDNALKN